MFFTLKVEANTMFPYFILSDIYSCGLSTTTIEYSCPSVFLCECVCVCVHDDSKNNGSTGGSVSIT